MNRTIALGLLLLTALLWSLGGLLIKSIEWHPLAIAGARSGLAAVTIFFIFRKFHFSWSVAQIGGALAYAATVILFVLATKMTTAANAILLQYTAPIYVGLFGAWFLGERTTKFDWLIIVLALSGMSLFFLDRLSLSGLWGNIIALISGVSFAWLALFLRKDGGRSSVEAIVLGNALAFLIGLPFFFKQAISASSLPPLIALGVIQLGVSYALYALAIRYVTAVEAILVPFIEPIMNPIWVLIVVGEKPGTFSVLGGAIILLAVASRGLKPLIRRGRFGFH